MSPFQIAELASPLVGEGARRADEGYSCFPLTGSPAEDRIPLTLIFC